MILLLFFSFLAGIATVLSPCVLPVLPAILSAGVGQGRYRPLGIVVGLILSFCFFTLALTSLVQATGLSANVLRYTAILIIGFFGLVMILPAWSEWFALLTSSIANLGSHFQSKNSLKGSGLISGLLLGIALGLVWTPCAGPILAAITALVATQSVTYQTVLLTFAYSLGAGIPLFLIAYGGNRALTVYPKIAKYSEQIRQLFGGLMILTALALAFNFDVVFQQVILKYLPNIQIENNAWVEKQLNQLRPAPIGYPNQDFSPNLDSWEEANAIQAPDIVGITQWINSQPLTLKDLRGKVILIDFWTYSCINCIRTFPYLISWYDKYQNKGLVIIGIHTPEFEFEKDFNNVKKATERFHIKYPVALDNHYQTWKAYHNAYWPAHYLIDQNGVIRQVHFGEGKYLETENAIRTLLHQAPLQEEKSNQEESIFTSLKMTPETYLGYQRAQSYIPQMPIIPNQKHDYDYQQPLDIDQVGLRGAWNIHSENIVSESDESILELNFMANRVYLVLGGQSLLPIKIDLDGQPLARQYGTVDTNQQGEIFVKESRKYDIIDLKGNPSRHKLTLHIPKGIEVYAFTFGMEH